MPVDPVIAVHPDQRPQQVKLLYQRSLLAPLTTTPIFPDASSAPAGLFPVFPPEPNEYAPQLDVRSKPLELRSTALSEPLTIE